MKQHVLQNWTNDEMNMRKTTLKEDLLAKFIICEAFHYVTQFWTYATKGNTFLTPCHSCNAFSEPRPSRTLELVEASKIRLPFIYTN